MNSLNENKELLKKIYSELENNAGFTEKRKEELMEIINKLENRFNADVVRKNMLVELKDKLKNIEINESETNTKKNILDLIKGIISGLINLLVSFPGIP